MLQTAGTSGFAAEEAKKALIGLARDLRGLAFAFNTKTSYMMLFDWMYPFNSKVFVTSLERRTITSITTIILLLLLSSCPLLWLIISSIVL